MADPHTLIALLGSRICHDLISPIGAIGNGVELMLMDGASHSPEMALISDSVAQANARIRFFRIAFGVSTPDQRLGRAEVVGLLSDLTRGGRLLLDWQPTIDLPRLDVKLAFLAIQCLETALAYGGRVQLQFNSGHWQITAEASKMKVDPALWEVLSNPNSAFPITAAQVHFALLAQELVAQNRPLTLEVREETIRLAF